MSLQDKRKTFKPQFQLRDSVSTADIRRNFSEGDLINLSYKSNTLAEIINDTIPIYRINCLPESYNENLSKAKKLTLDENEQVVKELNLFQ